ELVRHLEAAARSGSRSVLLDARSLSTLSTPQVANEIATILTARDLRALVLVDAAGADVDRFLDVVTGGAVIGVVDADAPAHVVFPATAELAAELASHRYPRRPAPALAQRVANSE